MQLLVHALSANLAVQSKFKIPEKQLASLLVMIRYCRDLRQRASAPKATIRPRLVAFQVLFSTTVNSAPSEHLLILCHFCILNETVELIKTPLSIPVNVQVSQTESACGLCLLIGTLNELLGTKPSPK